MFALFLLVSDIQEGLACNKGSTSRMAASNQRQTKSTTFQGMTIVYDSYGVADESLIFIHGWSCNRQLWAFQSPIYENHRSILIDLPGHGDSDSPHIDYNVELFARAVGKVVEQENIKRVVLIAHSLGGPIATMVLRLFGYSSSTRAVGNVVVAGIIYVDSFLHLPESYLNAEERKRLGQARLNDEKFIADINTLFTSDTSENIRETVLRTMLATPKHVRAVAVTSMTQPHALGYNEVYEQVPAINIIAPNCAPIDRHWFHHLPLLKVKEMTGVSHWLFLEKPEEFNQEVENFCRNISPSSNQATSKVGSPQMESW